ncbi:hypothetical protein V5799_031398 [Amblyomma americanum]|uniref:Uncharacterized protein n=1 Tax=Amblyomma americanum TaxID=6943 RepID=A0AAQ4EKJ8_AMBAM
MFAPRYSRHSRTSWPSQILTTTQFSSAFPQEELTLTPQTIQSPMSGSFHQLGRRCHFTQRLVIYLELLRLQHLKVCIVPPCVIEQLPPV